MQLKSANKQYLQQRLTYNLQAKLFPFFPGYNLSLIFCQLSKYLYFYKIKTCKVSCRKIRISISPRGENFQFLARGERYVYLKKNSPPVEISRRGEFTSPTYNTPFRFGLEKCLDYLTQVRLILKYIGLWLS